MCEISTVNFPRHVSTNDRAKTIVDGPSGLSLPKNRIPNNNGIPLRNYAEVPNSFKYLKTLCPIVCHNSRDPTSVQSLEWE